MKHISHTLPGSYGGGLQKMTLQMAGSNGEGKGEDGGGGGGGGGVGAALHKLAHTSEYGWSRPMKA